MNFGQFLIFLFLFEVISDCCGLGEKKIECGVQDVDENSLLKNGTVVKYEHPWKVALFTNKSEEDGRDEWEFFCNGALINEKVVLTVAFVILQKRSRHRIKAEDLKAILGARNLDDESAPGRVEKFIESIKIHDDWHPFADPFDGDIAILRLKEIVKFNRYIRPVCLPNTKSRSAERGEFVRWGRSKNGRQIDVTKTEIPILTFEECMKEDIMRDSEMSERQFCARDENATIIPLAAGGLYIKIDGIIYLRGASAFFGRGDATTRYLLFSDTFSYSNFLKKHGGAILSRDTSINICGSPSITSGLSSGGNKIKRGSYPWLAEIFRKEGRGNKPICGGTLISAKKVVTAAHCVHEKYSSKTNPSKLSVLLGAHNIFESLEANTQSSSVAKVKIHETWNPTSDKFTGDIAVLILAHPATFTDYVKPICLSQNLELQNDGIVASWGKNENGTVSGIAEQIKIPIVDKGICYEREDRLAKSGWAESFCAGREGVKVCSGDSGSGFFVKIGNKFYLKGIVSNAMLDGFCATNNLGLFSDVTKYIEFFEIIEGSNEDKINNRDFRMSQLKGRHIFA